MSKKFNLSMTALEVEQALKNAQDIVTNKPIKSFKITEHADGSITMKNTFTDDTYETIVLAAGEKPASITYNGTAIPIDWVVET